MLRRLDARVAALEGALIVALFAVMAGSVFLDACHRLFSAGEGRLGRLFVVAAVAFGVAYAGLRAREKAGTETGTRTRTGVWAGIWAGGIAGGSELLVRAMPNGLVWSQQMSLCLLLWVGLLGASLAARERAHIAFELAGKLWPRRLRRPAELAARMAAGGFSLFLALLAWHFAAEHYGEWSSSDGAAGLFEGFRVPRFVIYGFLPFPFTVMGLRFLAYGVRVDETEALS